MKTKGLSLVALFVLGTFTIFAANKTEKFEVSGKCGMCDTRIEKAAKSVEGVSAADWDLKTQMLEVSFDDTKTDVDKIQIAIAKVGHDTGKHKANDEVYDKLPACCKYERTPAKAKDKGKN